MNRLVIIPSAKKVSKELEIEIGDIPSGMIPIGGKPAIAYISDFYLSHGFKISVAVDQNKEEIIDYVSKSNLLINLGFPFPLVAFKHFPTKYPKTRSEPP